MKKFFANLLIAVLVLLWAGGIVCGLVFAVKAKSVATGLSFVALGALAFPTIRRAVLGMNNL